MGMVSQQKHNNLGSIPSGPGEYQGRLPFTSPDGQNGLASQPIPVCGTKSAVGTSGGGLIRHKADNAVAPIRQLEARSRSRGDRRVCSGLVHNHGICTPSMVPCTQGLAEGTKSKGKFGPNSSSVAYPGLVPGVANTSSRHTSSSSPATRHNPAIPELRQSNATDTTSTGRMEGLRQQFSTQGIPPEAIRLILSSWRKKTNANYNSAWRKWELWSQRRGVDPFSASLPDILSFLTTQFLEGRQYRSINCYRSALSSTHLPIEGFPVGKHPQVSRLLRGIFNERPRIPARGMCLRCLPI